MAYKLDEKNALDAILKIKRVIDDFLRTGKPIKTKTKSGMSKGSTGSCKYCSEEGLTWTNTNQGWRLLDENNEQHKCDDYQPMHHKGL